MKTSADEKPKNAIAKQVITPKRKYFVPSIGRTVEAESLEAVKAELEKTKQEKAGDE